MNGKNLLGLSKNMAKNKRLSPLENYKLTLGIELFKERGAAVLGELHRYQKKNGISINDASNASIQASNKLSDLVNTKVYLISSFDDLKKCNKQLDDVEKTFLNS